MNYPESLEYIHRVDWRKSVLGLSRVEELLSKLGHPEKELKFIHVAGTNGKGSVCAMFASVLAEAGYTVGLYTSPFIERFNERMQINGRQITDSELAEITTRIQPLADSMTDHPTEFELITCIAFLWFCSKKCDIVVLEVGMGGEFDATNIIESPELAVITAMGLDHVRELGPTMKDIARAKAGIIKNNCDVISYGGNPDADIVIKNCAEQLHANLYTADMSEIRPGRVSLNGQYFDACGRKNLFIALLGAYQISNATLVLTGIDVLIKKGWDISENSIYEGLKKTQWPARFELLRKTPPFILDGGHNPHGIRATAESLKRLFPDKKFIFIIGMMADKNIDESMDILLPLASYVYTVTPNNPRAMPAEELASLIIQKGCRAEACASIEKGVSKAILSAGTKIPVCAVGSLYMTGDIRIYTRKLFDVL